MIAASQGTPRNVAILIAAVMFIGWLLYLVFNLRRAKPEIGSEIELAPNRRTYYDDDVLETRHLGTEMWAWGCRQHRHRYALYWIANRVARRAPPRGSRSASRARVASCSAHAEGANVLRLHGG